MNDSKLPKISVIIPVYNAEKYLSEAIESILNQTFTDFELIIINDTSTDKSKEIILSYAKKDSRIVFIDNKKNIGPSTRNIGFDIAKGEFIALIDADDIALPTRFEKQLDVFHKNPEIGVCATWFTRFGKENKIIKHPVEHDQIKIEMLKGCCIGNPTVMIRKNVLNNLRFQSDFNCSEDYELWSRLITKTKFYTIPESLLQYRWHETNLSQTKINEERTNNIFIKTQLLSEFGITEDDSKIDSYLNVLNYKKGLQPDEIIDVIECANNLLKQNKKLKNFNPILLEEFIQKSIIKTIRKAGNYNKTFLKYLKQEQPVIYSKLSLYDKIRINIKSL